jgi:peptidyl-prolyl cis-trans isomerase C
MKKLAALVLTTVLAPGVHAETTDTDTVLISRGNAQLTIGDVDAYVSEAPPEMRAGLLANFERKEQILTQLMVLETLAQEAIDANMLQDPLVQARLNLARTRLLAQLRTEQLQAEAQIDAEALARERYLSNPARYRLAETVTVRHILVEARTRPEKAAQERIAEVVAKLEGGASFEELAREYSDDQGSAAEGGLLPASARTDLDKAFSDAAFELATPGQRTAPVRSSYGYHIIELVEKSPERARTFEEVREDMIREIKAAHAEKTVRDYVDVINSRPIDANEEVLRDLADRYIRLYGDAAAKPPAAAGSPSD